MSIYLRVCAVLYRERFLYPWRLVSIWSWCWSRCHWRRVARATTASWAAISSRSISACYSLIVRSYCRLWCLSVCVGHVKFGSWKCLCVHFYTFWQLVGWGAYRSCDCKATQQGFRYKTKLDMHIFVVFCVLFLCLFLPFLDLVWSVLASRFVGKVGCLCTSQETGWRDSLQNNMQCAKVKRSSVRMQKNTTYTWVYWGVPRRQPTAVQA